MGTPAPSTYPDQLEIRHIVELIPHRPPWLLVEAAEIIRDRPVPSIRGKYRVKDRMCVGHFPGLPIFPGVLWQEIANQLAGILIAHSLGHMVDGRYVQTDRAKVTAPAYPDDLLTMEVQITMQRGGFIRFQACGYCGGKLAFEGTQVCTQAG